jgi:hypothetical protein
MGGWRSRSFPPYDLGKEELEAMQRVILLGDEHTCIHGIAIRNECAECLNQ